MCGIAGIFNYRDPDTVSRAVLEKMILALKHRGPDEIGLYIKNNIGIANSRLSIIDLEGGTQPIHNENKTKWIVFNGEIFNYIELREILETRGHRFYTKTDTEVIIHLYEEYGYEFLNHLNGQFAIAIWDSSEQKLILARDRVGIIPLFFTILDNKTLLFGSEIKSLFKFPRIKKEIDPNGIAQIFTYWVNIPPTTSFKDINELSPGKFLVIDKNGIELKQYWDIVFPSKDSFEYRTFDFYKKRIQELLYESVKIRLRADVPVASYLSGGIDSSIASALIKKYHNNNLMTFSVTFKDTGYDESDYQKLMVNYLQTSHREVKVDNKILARNFHKIIWFAEKPTLRTAPAPLFELSGLVRRNNIKVVLTGEGADEVFAGYNIFKEAKIRHFWSKFPDSKIRPLLLLKLYPYIKRDRSNIQAFWQGFFKRDLSNIENPFYSHLIRWNNTSQLQLFFSNNFLKQINKEKLEADLKNYINPEIEQWDVLSRAQYLEMKLFLPGYLLCTQGDRMLMANSVEGRFPYLDHNLIEFVNKIPPNYKLRFLNEKYLLKETFRNFIPDQIINRPKQPYRAPISQSFFSETYNEIIFDLLSEDKIKNYGYFDYKKISRLLTKIGNGNRHFSAREEMAIVGIISLQLLHYLFIESFAD